MPERQAILLDPAEAEFAAKGFAAASLNRILTEAGMSKGQAYHYITDKADLYAAVITRALDRIEASIVAPATLPHDANSFWHAVSNYLGQVTDLLMRDERLGALARGIYDGPETQAALAAPFARLRASLDRVIATGQSVGAMRTDLPHSLFTGLLLAVARETDRWFARHARDLTPDEAQKVNAQALEVIRAMAEPQGG